ncbi:tRNA (guanine(37)-N1)-methyltransferase [Striga asiatica]|uniref:tRNA (Guanine(37)-N1)-methyltransferase n=1 Tax=Striga asiatica TaxID=4170 RepID=A0A5A7NWM3_STRAF|nr:tRNA (guanine(37)-N1)-methyltransferase [Striga asiatica]
MLDEKTFDVQLNLLALRVPREHCKLATRILNGYLLDRPRIKPVTEDPTSDKNRYMLLSERIQIPDLSEIPDDKVEELKRLFEIQVVPYSFTLGYSYWSVDHILKQILPPGIEVPSSFETIGHIAHLNIADELLPYKDVIAKVIYDGCQVYANDLNPDSIRFLKINAEINKVSNLVRAYNLDARKFISSIIQVPSTECCPESDIAISKTSLDESHLRNLHEGGAVKEVQDENGGNLETNGQMKSKEESSVGTVKRRCESLFEGNERHNDGQCVPEKKKRWSNKHIRESEAFNAKPWEHIDHMPLEVLSIRNTGKEAETALGARIQDPIFYRIRDVAPNKAMFCLSFRLPEEACIGGSC